MIYILIFAAWYVIGFLACAWSFEFEFDETVIVICILVGFFGVFAVPMAIIVRNGGKQLTSSTLRF